MEQLPIVVLFISVPFLQACSEPVTVHIQNYDGPIILHSANSDNQSRNHCNQYETECTCVTKHTGCHNQPSYLYPKPVNNGYCDNDARKTVVCTVLDSDKTGGNYNYGNRNCQCGRCGWYNY